MAKQRMVIMEMKTACESPTIRISPSGLSACGGRPFSSETFPNTLLNHVQCRTGLT